MMSKARFDNKILSFVMIELKKLKILFGFLFIIANFMEDFSSSYNYDLQYCFVI